MGPFEPEKSCLDALLPLDERLQEFRQLASVVCAADAQLDGHCIRNVATPALCYIEGDDENWVAVLAIEQVGHQAFKIRPFDAAPAPGAAEAAKVVEHQVHITITAGDD